MPKLVLCAEAARLLLVPFVALSIQNVAPIDSFKVAHLLVHLGSGKLGEGKGRGASRFRKMFGFEFLANPVLRSGANVWSSILRLSYFL